MTIKTKATTILVGGALAIGGVVAGGSTSAFAYGAADHAVAQVEISGNCDNPSFPLCAPEPDGVRTGGVWAWCELNSTGGDATSGTMDATVAFCSHVVGGGGPGGAGAFGHPDHDGIWWTIHSLAAAPAGAFPFFDTSTTYPSYYVLPSSLAAGPMTSSPSCRQQSATTAYTRRRA